MGVPDEGPPIVPLPERLDRRLRLGPFACARDALRFVTYATVGAVVAPFTSPYVWLAFVGLGFTACVVRSDGQSLDERAIAFVLWEFRARAGGAGMTRDRATRTVRSGLLAVGPGRYAAIVRTGGTPSTYLPPAELARRFERFREVLRSTDGTFGWLATCRPMSPGPVRPAPAPPGDADRSANAGYAELVEMLCRRRQLRQVDLFLVTERVGAEGLSDLETRIRSLTEGLASLGLRGTRLRDRRLVDAARRWGWA